MTRLIQVYLPYVISCFTILVVVLQGNLHRNAWLLSLLSQGLWFTWIVADEQWGMVPLNAFMVGLAVRNHLKWRRELPR